MRSNEDVPLPTNTIDFLGNTTYVKKEGPEAAAVKRS